MPKLKANHRVIAAAPAIGGKRTRYRIEGVDGLWLDVSPKGKRVWYVRYQPGGRGTRHFRYFRIGSLEQHGLAAATGRARQVMGKVYGPERLDPRASAMRRQKAAQTRGCDLRRSVRGLVRAPCGARTGAG